MLKRFILMLMGVLILVVPGVAQGATTNVGDGTAASCTNAALQAAIDAGGLITFNCGGPVTIQITQELFFQDNDVTIDGGGQVTLQGTAGERIIHFRTWGFDAAQTVTLRNLTIRDAYLSGAGQDANGAAVYVVNQAAEWPNDFPTLNVENVDFINNVSDQTSTAGNGYDYGGGAIFIGAGVLTVSDSTFTGNEARWGAGAAIHGLGSDITITNTTFENNTSTTESTSDTTSGYAAALYVDGAHPLGGGGITITDSVFLNNSAANQGGAAYINLYPSRNTSLVIDRSAFIGNSVSGGGMGLGGAISGGGTGGAVDVTITRSLFNGNTVADQSGGASGGALAFAQAAHITVANSTFVNNEARGVCTDCFNANGGAMYVVNNPTPFQVINSTIAYNYAGWVGGGITGSPGVLSNTIVAHNTADNGGNGWGIQFNCSDELTEGGSNIQYPADSDTDCTNSITIADPLLGALTDGVLPLQAGSPAIDAGVDATCAAEPVNNADLRGLPRTQGTGCDIGSMEVQLDANLIKNPGFEAPITGRAESGWIWLSSMPENNADKRLCDAGLANFGECFFVLYGDQATIEGVRQYVEPPTVGGQAGESYTFSFRVAARDLPGGAPFLGGRVVVLDQTQQPKPREIHNCPVTMTGTFGWTLVECTFTTGIDYTRMKVEFGWRDVSSGIIGLDEVTLIRN